MRATILARRVVVACALLFLAACAEKVGAPAGEGPLTVASSPLAQPRAGSTLAYETEVQVRADDEVAIVARVKALQARCAAAPAGECELLELSQRTGDWPSARIVLRVVPEAIDAYVADAVAGATLIGRATLAEDLAEAVATTESRIELARRTQRSLTAMLERDLGASDLIAVTEKLAALEAQLEALGREQATQRRRIATHKLGFGFSTGDDHGVSMSTLYESFESSLVDGLDGVVMFLGYALPFGIPLFLLALAWRWAWRKVTRRESARSDR